MRQMKAAGVVRRVDQLGRIVLPKALRRRYGMDVGDPVEIAVQGETIILEKYRPRCVFSGSTENVRELNGVYVSEECLEDLRQLYEQSQA